MKNKLIPIASVVIGLAAFVLTHLYLQGERDKLRRERERFYGTARKIEVIAAKEDIPGGTVIREGDVGYIEVPESTAPDRVIRKSQVDLIFGRKVVFDVSARKPLMWTDIEGGAPGERGLAGVVQVGLRAVSLSVGGAQAVSCMVKPSDHVDVLGTFSFPSKQDPAVMETVTLTVLQDVTVLATGQDLARDDFGSQRRRASGYSTVTLEVTAREAELLVFAEQMKGRLTLTLRNPDDVSFEKDLEEINFDHLEGKLPELNMIRQKEIRHR